MLPTALVIGHQPHDYITRLLAHNGGTYMFKGPWLASMDMLWTTNPLDINHIMSKKFSNYLRGHKFRKIFDILGDGFSKTDGELWELQRKTIMSLLKLPGFQNLFQDTILNKVERELMPMLKHVCEEGVEIDLHEVLQRFAFDTTSTLLFDFDPQSMSLDFPHIPFEKAFSDIEEAIFHRYLMPSSLWKLQQLLRVGKEKKLKDAWRTVDQFIYNFLAQKQREFTNMNYDLHEKDFKLSMALMRELKDHCGTSEDPNKFLRDVFFNLMIAGRDSTGIILSWLFYLVAKHPIVEDKIREEVKTKLEMKIDGKWKDLNTSELHKLVYLHGALCETLRLFPSIPFQNKTPLQPDTLPSGYQVDPNTTIILCYYSMGRMKSIWGKDCMEFKPERWISTEGRLNHEPSYKFPAFNVGPRSCLGKEMSFSQMKMVALTIICQYHVELVEGHHVFPYGSVLLKMKNGMKVKLTKHAE